MARAYKRFLKTGIDLSPLGVEQRTDSAAYFCTPKGASIIGWAGVDGIHYCFIRGFGEMVFAVSPSNAYGEYIHPLAEDFTDFLRLLLACGDAAALEQAWMWDEKQFDSFLREDPAMPDQLQALAAIVEKMKLSPMEKPWQYIKRLQASFDYGRIRYAEDLDDPDMNPAAQPEPAEWRVYFDGNFWGHHGRSRAGKELRVGAQFDWAGHRWLVPSVYSCGGGLVADICMRAEPESIRRFMDKWDLAAESEADGDFSEEQRMQMELDNPLRLDIAAQITLNGKKLCSSHGCGVSYIPCLPENDTEADWIVGHYGLDRSYGWMVWRYAFPWVSKRRADIKTLSLTLSQQPVSIPGPHFRASAAGDTFEFVSYIGGTKHTLTVQEYERQTMEKAAFLQDGLEYPSHYHAMSYTVSPELPENILTISDCSESDRPRLPQRAASDPAAAGGAAFIGIIGGSDGPTAIIFGGGQNKLRTAFSSLHFEPVESIEWRLVFHEKQFPDAEFELI